MNWVSKPWCIFSALNRAMKFFNTPELSVQTMPTLRELEARIETNGAKLDLILARLPKE